MSDLYHYNITNARIQWNESSSWHEQYEKNVWSYCFRSDIKWRVASGLGSIRVKPRMRFTESRYELKPLAWGVHNKMKPMNLCPKGWMQDWPSRVGVPRVVVRAILLCQPYKPPIIIISRIAIELNYWQAKLELTHIKPNLIRLLSRWDWAQAIWALFSNQVQA